MQIGFNGRFFSSNWRPFREEIAFARSAGFTVIQCRGKEEGLNETHTGDPLPVVAASLHDAGIMAVMEIMVGIDATGRTNSGMRPLDLLVANLPAIDALPCPYVHWHVYPLAPLSQEVLREIEGALIPQFRRGVELSQEHGFALGFEHNDPDTVMFADPARCGEILTAVSGLHFVWDFNHTAPQHLAGFIDLIPAMSMLHISDTPIPATNHHLPLGLGGIDLAAYCEPLLRAWFSGPAILEIGGLPKTSGVGRDTDEALTHSLHLLQEVITAAQNRQEDFAQ